MALLLAPSRRSRLQLRLPASKLRPRLDGPPSVTFTRMTPVEGRCCLGCALPAVATVEDFANSAGLRQRQPVTYLQCAACGSRDQTED